MGSCYKCGTQITLKEEEVRCDNCNEIVNYPCHSCKQWFSIEGAKLCAVCGFYLCPECGSCGENCEKEIWFTIIKEMVGETLTNKKIRKITDYIEQIKSTKDRKNCFKGVPISYAKNRIKMCLAKMEGYGKKDFIDQTKFKERLQKLQQREVGYSFIISKERESGSYGQELRDVCNLMVCLGKLNVKKKINKDKREYFLYTRIQESPCEYLLKKDVVIKKCPRDCGKTEFTKEATHCECKYTKGKKIGESPELIVKTTNEDSCQMNRGNFKKRQDEKEIQDTQGHL